jgi:uracil-DNA glycosylase
VSKSYNVLEVKVPANMGLSERVPLRSAKVMVVGNYPGNSDVKAVRPFGGTQGYVMDKWLSEVGLASDDIAFAYAFKRKPIEGQAKNIFHNRNVTKAMRKGGWTPAIPEVSKYGYVRDEWAQYRDQLFAEIDAVGPNIVVAAGDLALWALTGEDKIGTYRGAFQYSVPVNGKRYKIMPTHAMSSIFAFYDFKVEFMSDMRKVAAEQDDPVVQTIEREIWIRPNISDINSFVERYIKPLSCTTTPLSYDIETRDNQITCIGFAPSPELALCIPFTKSNKNGDVIGSYWVTVDEEVAVWNIVKGVLEDTNIVKLAHNCSYDSFVLIEKMGISVRGRWEDTMHMHHALQPELRKSLSHLSTLYTKQSAWKSMVKHKNNKRDDV